jgi:GxxExxY protein
MDKLVKTKYDEITYKIIGAAMDVHGRLGPGLKEEHYQKAMIKALSALDLNFEEQKQIGVYFERTLAGLLFLDIFVEGSIVVELKALSRQLTKDELAQVITYLKASGSEIGLLINFGRKYLEFRRVFPPKKISQFDQNDWRFAVKFKQPEFRGNALDKAQRITCALH